MLRDYFEDFVLLERTQSDDELGGTAEVWQEGVTFLAGVTQVMGKEIDVCGLLAMKATPVLLHEWDVTLVQGDRVRRLRDGAEFRITGHSSDMRTPPMAGTAYCQVPIERLVTAP